MKKLWMLLFASSYLFIFMGCQNKVLVSTPEQFLTNFANDYFTVIYDENKTNLNLYNEQTTKLKPYFTDESFKTFTANSFGLIPINAAINNKSNVSVDNVSLNVVFDEKENKTMGYTMTLSVNIDNAEWIHSIEQTITLSIEKINNEYKIYAFHIMKVPDSLQK